MDSLAALMFNKHPFVRDWHVHIFTADDLYPGSSKKNVAIVR